MGDVYASQRITLSAKARVSGNVYYKLIEMTSGATVNGQLVYQGDTRDAPGRATHQRGETPPCAIPRQRQTRKTPEICTSGQKVYGVEIQSFHEHGKTS